MTVMRWYGAQSSRARWAANVPQNEPSTQPENRTQTGCTGASGENAPSKNFRSAAPLCVVPSGRTATGRPPLNSAACVARACRAAADGFASAGATLEPFLWRLSSTSSAPLARTIAPITGSLAKCRHHHRARVEVVGREEPLQQTVVRREDDDRRGLAFHAPVVDSQPKHAEAPHREARQSNARRSDTRARHVDEGAQQQTREADRGECGAEDECDRCRDGVGVGVRMPRWLPILSRCHARAASSLPSVFAAVGVTIGCFRAALVVVQRHGSVWVALLMITLRAIPSRASSLRVTRTAPC